MENIHSSKLESSICKVDFKPIHKENLNKTDIMLLPSQGDTVYKSFNHALKTQKIFGPFGIFLCVFYPRNCSSRTHR